MAALLAAWVITATPACDPDSGGEASSHPVEVGPSADWGLPDDGMAPDNVLDSEDAERPDLAMGDGATKVPDATPGEPPPAGSQPRFRFPIADSDRASIQTGWIVGIDHDGIDQGANGRLVCQNYADRPFPFCYDGHEGTDFMLRGGFRAMDAGSAWIVAAAGARVIEVVDGHYDRCHADIESADVDCDGHEMRANRVRLRHALGWESEYVHLMRGSVAVSVGDELPCGAPLGRVGSSGYSVAPHLHFQVRDPRDRIWDPYAGPLSQPESLWHRQADEDGLPGAECDADWGLVPAP